VIPVLVIPVLAGCARRTRPGSTIAAGSAVATPAVQATTVPAIAVTMATAGPVTARWNVADLTGLGVLKGDKGQPSVGRVRARSASTLSYATAVGGRPTRRRADSSRVQGDGGGSGGCRHTRRVLSNGYSAPRFCGVTAGHSIAWL
jgi:hypothetical protein